MLIFSIVSMLLNQKLWANREIFMKKFLLLLCMGIVSVACTMEQPLDLYQVMRNNLDNSVNIFILKDIYTDLEIAPFLGFRGGAAAHLFYNLSRPPVDLDFDLLDATKEDFVFERVQKILEEYGIVKAQKKRLRLAYLLSYNDTMYNTYNIKVDINLRKFKSQYEVRSYLGIAMKVMVQADMAAHKLAAMYERFGKANHDIFDTWFLLKNNWPINVEVIEKSTDLPMKEFLQKCVDKLETMSDCEMPSGLGELVDEKQKVWAENNLRKDTIFLLKLKMQDL